MASYLLIYFPNLFQLDVMHITVLLLGLSFVLFNSFTYSLPIAGSGSGSGRHVDYDQSPMNVKKRSLLKIIRDIILPTV